MTDLALVTGGARRIGADICRHLHQQGMDIALHYRHSIQAAEQLAAELNARRPDSCQLWHADLATVDSIARLADAFLQRHPRLTLLVNNASGFEPTPIEQCNEQQFDAMLTSNLKGPYFLIQALLPALRAAGGSIVNLIDIHSERPLRDYNAYCAAKAGLASLTRSLALELGPAVRVNGVSPGVILWPEDEEAYDATLRAQMVAATPMNRTGSPDDIARSVAFFALEAPFITGQILAVDGGLGFALPRTT